jgi:D-alanyl-lipoteichoic acid acyltransferase DltB (MBOAT superfamily)
MFGFHLPENFNFPIWLLPSEVLEKLAHYPWQWLMDYLYIPLGAIVKVISEHTLTL